MRRNEQVADRRRSEIENIAIAKQTKDAEVVDLVHFLEGVSAEVCSTREQRTSLASECKEVSRQHEQVVVQVNAVRDKVHEQQRQILQRQKDIRDQETELARVNAEIITANEELSRVRTNCEREATSGDTARSDLYNLEAVLESTKAEGKAKIGRLRDEELLQAELTKKHAVLEFDIQKLEEQEVQLNGHSSHLEQK